MASVIKWAGLHLFSNPPYFTGEPTVSQKAFKNCDGWLGAFGITELGCRRRGAECESTNDDESFACFLASFLARVPESFKDTRGGKEGVHDMSEDRDIIARPA